MGLRDLSQGDGLTSVGNESCHSTKPQGPPLEVKCMKVTAFDMVKAKVPREGANLKGSQGVDEINDESGRPDEPANNLYDEPRDHRSSQGA